MPASLNSPETDRDKTPIAGVTQLDSADTLAGVVITKRFIAYLSGDGLNYFLGSAIYLFLIRALTDQQYGAVSVATNIYQMFVMFVALGLDLLGTGLILAPGSDTLDIIRRVQRLRIYVALLFCLPIMTGAALYYYKTEDTAVAVVILGGFAMVLARAWDLNYVAVALSQPSILARTRVVGLSLFLAALVICRTVVVSNLWMIQIG